MACAVCNAPETTTLRLGAKHVEVCAACRDGARHLLIGATRGLLQRKKPELFAGLQKAYFVVTAALDAAREKS